MTMLNVPSRTVSAKKAERLSELRLRPTVPMDTEAWWLQTEVGKANILEADAEKEDLPSVVIQNNLEVQFGHHDQHVLDKKGD
jgi:hypothetical protein